MATTFEAVASEVRAKALQSDETGEALLRKPDRRARLVLGLFARQDQITAADVSHLLGLSSRQVRELLAGWTESGWLEVSDAARKTRKYRLSAEYRRFIG